MKNKSMAEMNRERALRKAKEQADDDENPSAYYKFLNLFYKNKKEQDDKQKTNSSTKTDD